MAIRPRKNRVSRRRDELSLGVHTPSLPPEIIFYIMSFLPVLSAAKIGALSKFFRHLWGYSRWLDFGISFAKTIKRDSIGGNKFNMIVDRIMEHHVGSEVRTFRFYDDGSLDKDLLKKWFRIVRAKGVEEIDLDFSADSSERYEIPTSLLEGESTITVVKLTCVFLPPVTFTGLRHLRSLTLKNTDMAQMMVNVITANCLFLEELILIICQGLYDLIIDHSHGKMRLKKIVVSKCSGIKKIDISIPTLTTFQYSGNIGKVQTSFNVPKLEDLELDFTTSRDYVPKYISFQLNMSHVRVLTINSTCIEASRIKEAKLSNVKEVQILMNETSYCNLYDLVMFLKNCHIVERIFLDVNEFYFNYGPHWEFHDKIKFASFTHKFEHLRSIKIKGFKLHLGEWELVKFFLLKSPILEMMVLVTPVSWSKNVNVLRIEEHRPMFDAWRRSPNVNVVVFQHPNDESCLMPSHSSLRCL